MTVQRRAQQDVDQRLPGHRDAGPRDRLAQLRPGPRPVLQRAHHGGDPALGGVRRDALLPQPALAGAAQLRRRQGVQPGVVLGPHQVQRAAAEPVDDELAPLQGGVDVGDGQPGRARTDRQPGAAQVLRLHRQHPLDDGADAGGRRAAQQLRLQPGGVDAHASGDRGSIRSLTIRRWISLVPSKIVVSRASRQ